MSDPTRTERVTKRVEAVLKSGALLTGLLYATGLLVSSLHLGRYGVSPFGLLRVEYIFAGAWYITPIIVGALAASAYVAYFQITLREVPRPNGAAQVHFWRKAGIGFYVFLVGSFLLAVLAVVFYIAARELFDLGLTDYLVVVSKQLPIALAFTVALAAVAVYSWMFIVLATAGPPRDRLAFAAGSGLALAILGTLLVGYTCYFTFSLFPRIPAAVGGGKPVAVQFIMKGATDSSSRSVYPEPSSAPGLSVEYDLLHATKDCYVVLTNDSHRAPLEIRADSVLGIRRAAWKRPRSAGGGE